MKERILHEAFKRLYPNRDFKYNISLKYSGRFKDYNANLKLYGNNLQFNLSKKWRFVSEEIQIGLIQELIISLLKDKRTTTNIDLYNSFVKKIHIAIEKEDCDPLLEDSFNRVNDEYFNGVVEIPNLKFGQMSTRVWGNYAFNTDTITMSLVLKQDAQALDFVMYHELLHKKLKFKHKNGRSYHHTGEFRSYERRFKDFHLMEDRLKVLTRKKFL